MLIHEHACHLTDGPVMDGETVGNLLTLLELSRPAQNNQNQLVPVCHCDTDPKNCWGIRHAYSIKVGLPYSGTGSSEFEAHT